MLLLMPYAADAHLHATGGVHLCWSSAVVGDWQGTTIQQPALVLGTSHFGCVDGRHNLVQQFEVLWGLLLC